MAAEKGVAVEPLLHLRQRVAGHIAPAVLGIEHGGAVLALHQQNVLEVDEAHALPVAQHQPALHRARRGIHRRAHGLHIKPEKAVPRPLKRLDHAVHLEGLDQIIEGIDLEGVAHVGVVRGGEDDDDGRVHVLDGAGTFHAAHLRHLHIQKDHVGLELFGQLQRGFAVPGLAGELKAIHFGDDLAHDGAHAGVIVGDEDAQWFHG